MRGCLASGIATFCRNWLSCITIWQLGGHSVGTARGHQCRVDAQGSWSVLHCWESVASLSQIRWAVVYAAIRRLIDGPRRDQSSKKMASSAWRVFQMFAPFECTAFAVVSMLLLRRITGATRRPFTSRRFTLNIEELAALQTPA
jgi:hypothetical protein